MMPTKRWIHVAALTLMTFDVSLLYLVGGSLRAEIALLFTFVAVFGAYFYSRTVLISQLALVAAAIALPMAVPAADSPSGDQLIRLALLFPALCIIGMLVSFLRVRVEKREAELDLQTGQDPSTGLLNATGFARVLEYETQRAIRTHRAIVVLVLDARIAPGAADPLGNVRLVRLIGRAIAGRLGSDDHAARLHGPRFAVSGPDADAIIGLAGALTAAIRARLASFGYADDAIDLRIGRASFPIDTHTQRPDRLVEIAQNRLAPDLAFEGGIGQQPIERLVQDHPPASASAA
jgi:GGDEF domain-containing protein